MGDNWDDSDDDWDNASDDLDAKLGLNKLSTGDDDDAAPNFDDEEDIAVKEKERAAKASQAALKTKGNALKKKKELEEQRKMEEEVARMAVEAEAEMEANMSTDERRALERQRVEEADNSLTDDLFGGVDSKAQGGGAGGGAMGAGDTVKLKDLKDHLMHAKKVSQCIAGHGKTHLATAFLKECVQGCKDVLDDDAISDLIKVMNVIKNEKVQAQKRKVKGQAQKSKKQDKVVTAKAQKIQSDLFGDSNKYDEYDDMGAQYEDEYDGFF